MHTDIKLPNFFVVGAARSATTSLHYILNSHPQIFMCPKEPNYFIFENGFPDIDYPDKENLIKRSVTSIEEYKQLFKGTQNYIAVGDVSPLYLYSPGAARRIKKVCGDVKIIIILRNPVDRAFSHMIQYCKSQGLLPSKAIELFEKYLKKERNDPWVKLIIELGLYSNQVARYIDVFGQNLLKIYKYEDFLNNNKLIIKDILRLLNVEINVPLKILKSNTANQNEIKVLKKLKPIFKKVLPVKTYNDLVSLYHKILNFFSLKRTIEIPSYLRHSLLENYYFKDIQNLEKLINIDLKDWLK